MKPLKALEAQVSNQALNDLTEIFLGWLFGNKEETYHSIIDVDWLLDHERDNPECDDVVTAIRILTDELGNEWRKTQLLYLKGENSI